MAFTTLRTFTNQLPEQEIPPGDSDFVSLPADSIEISTKNLILTGSSGDISLKVWRFLDSEKQVIAVLSDAFYGDNRLILSGLSGTSPGYYIQFSAPSGSNVKLSGTVLARAITTTSSGGSSSPTLTTCTGSTVTVGTSSVQVLASNTNRKNAVIVNNGAADVTLVRSASTAVANQGILLKASGGAYEITSFNLYTGQINAIAASGSNLLSIEECT